MRHTKAQVPSRQWLLEDLRAARKVVVGWTIALVVLASVDLLRQRACILFIASTAGLIAAGTTLRWCHWRRWDLQATRTRVESAATVKRLFYRPAQRWLWLCASGYIAALLAARWGELLAGDLAFHPVIIFSSIGIVALLLSLKYLAYLGERSSAVAMPPYDHKYLETEGLLVSTVAPVLTLLLSRFFISAMVRG